jgi:hypothetical protein
MVTDWIENLACEIKHKNREAAEHYGRMQHTAAVTANLGMAFFISLISCLEDNIAAIRHQLQGDVTSSDTIIQTVNTHAVKLTRARFPWFDANVTYQGDGILLDYAKDRGVSGDPNQDRKTVHFAFDVRDDDLLSVREDFQETARTFNTPEELSRHIVELLFGV